MTLPAYAMGQLNFAEMYERFLVAPLFRPWAELLLDRAQPRPGERVLDLACGTGIVARLARERLQGRGTITGVDLSAQMLAVAQSLDPQVTWREGSALALPFADGETFDLILCQQGLQFFPDKPAAAREMRRVLAPGGRIAIASWCPLAQAPLFRELHRAGEALLGPVLDQRFSYGDAQVLEQLLKDAGFREVRVEPQVTQTTRLPDGVHFARMNAMALVGMGTLPPNTSNERRAELLDQVAKAGEACLPAFADPEAAGGVVFETRSLLATARA